MPVRIVWDGTKVSLYLNGKIVSGPTAYIPAAALWNSGSVFVLSGDNYLNNVYDVSDDIVIDEFQVLVGSQDGSPIGTPLYTVTPASGSGSSQTFTFGLTDPGNWQTGTVADVILNDVFDGQSACYFALVPSTRTLYLVDDAGNAGGPFAGNVFFAPNGTGSGTASNSQCTINGTGSSYTIAGTQITLTLNMTFTSSFSGNRTFYVGAQNVSPPSGWQAIGSWMVP